MGAFDDLYEQKPTGAEPAQSPTPSGRGGAFADLWSKPSAQEQVEANLPKSLNVAGFDTGIPLPPTVAKGLVQLGEGANSVIHGARQRYNEITGDEAMVDQLRQEAANNRELFKPMQEAHPVASTIMGILGQAGMTAPLMLIPGAGASSAATRMGNALTQGAGAGFVTPTTAGESVMGNTALGAAAGAGVSGALSGLGKSFNAVAGRFADPEAAARYAASKASGVPLTAGEMMQSPVLRNAETLLENVPVVGTGGFRKAQAGATLNAAEQAVNGARPAGVEDAGEAIHASLRRVLGNNKAEARQLYDAVDQAALSPGVTAIAPSQTRVAAQQLLKEYPDIFERLPAGTVKSKLEALIGATSPKNSAIVGANGQPFAKPAEMTFEEARFLRKQLGNYIDRASKSTGAVGSDEMRQLTVLKASLESDINNWGTNSANASVRNAYNAANSFYGSKVAPFKDALINKAAGKDYDTDTIFRTFVKPGRENLAGKLVGNLDAEGHQAVKYGVLKSSFEKAMDDKTGVFSPLKFASGIDNLGKANNAIFSDIERQQLNGLVKVMTAAQRAGQYMENPPTGNRVAQMLLGGAGIAGPAMGAVSGQSVLAGAGIAKLMTTLTTTDSGKRFLMAASKMPGESKELDSMFARGAAHFFANPKGQ